MKKADREHLSRVAELGCIACRVMGYVDTPAEIHHLRTGVGKGMRNNHRMVLPLCPHHHRTGPHGEAFHAGKQTWQDKFGTEEELLEAVNKLLRERVHI